MKKLSIALLSLVLLTGVISAKGGNMFAGANAGVAIPLGDFGKAYSLGFGGLGVFMYQINPMLGVTGSIGYLRWGGDNDISFSSVPLLFGARYMFGTGDTKPYGMADLGLHFSSSSVNIPGTTFTNPLTGQTQTIGGGSASGSSTNFGVGLGGGVLHPLSKNLYLDANAKINFIFATGASNTYVSVLVGVLAAI